MGSSVSLHSVFFFFFFLSSFFAERFLRVRVEQWAPLTRAAGPGNGAHLSLFIQFFLLLFLNVLEGSEWSSGLHLSELQDQEMGGSTG